jgi:ATP synthase protein I
MLPVRKWSGFGRDKLRIYVAVRQDQDPKERSSATRNVAMGVMIPGMLFGCVLIGCVLGFYVDKWLDSAPWGLLVGLILGSVAGVREMLKLLKKIQSDKG